MRYSVEEIRFVLLVSYSKCCLPDGGRTNVTRVVGEYAPDPLAIYSAKTRRSSEFLTVAYDAWRDTVTS